MSQWPPAPADAPDDAGIYDLCVVGSGISGLAGVEAYLSLKPEASVLVLEADDRFGGHDNTVEVYNESTDGGASEKTLVDCGFMVYNERTYPNMLRLFGRLGVEGAASDMSLSTYYGRDDTWSFGSGLGWALANVWRRRLWGFLGSHARFRKEARRLLAGRAAGPGGEAYTLGQFAEDLGDGEFADCWLRPFVKAVWSLPTDGKVDGYPALPLFQFMENHGFLSHPAELPGWLTPKHRSRSLVAALLGRSVEGASNVHGGRLITCKASTRVTSVAVPDADGVMAVEALPKGMADKVVFRAKHVLLASSGVAQASIAGRFPERRGVLSRIGVSRTRGILHQDRRYMPKRRSDWCAWNVERNYSTYWINKIQGQKGGDLFFTLPFEGFRDRNGKVMEDIFDDAVLEQFEGGVLHVWDTTHPQYDGMTPGVVAELRDLSRGSRLQHCGAWMRHGFHEDGVVSARLAVRELLLGGGAEALGEQLPVYFPMASSPNIFADRVRVPLVHTVVSKAGPKSFRSQWHGLLFNSLSPPQGVLACDHAFAPRATDETSLLQDGAIREAFRQHTGVFPAGPVLVWTMPRSASAVPAFNPFSWYAAFDGAEREGSAEVLGRAAEPVAFLAEVHNTPWGESVFYGWRHEGRGFPYAVRHRKRMHVSPMNKPPDTGAASEYVFTLKSPRSVSISLWEEHEEAFRAEFHGDQAEVCDGGPSAPRWNAFGCVYALAEVYLRAASKVFRGERPFNTYTCDGEHTSDESRAENRFVWVSGLGYWSVAVLYFALRPASASTLSLGTELYDVHRAEWFTGFLLTGTVSLVASRRYHESSESDLLSGVISYGTWMASRSMVFLALIMESRGAETFGVNLFTVRCCLRWAGIVTLHSVVLPLLPIARCSRVSLQIFEPVIAHVGRAFAGISCLYVRVLWEGLCNVMAWDSPARSHLDSDLEPLFSSSRAKFDTLLLCCIFWVAAGLLVPAFLQLAVYPRRVHHRRLGLRAPVHAQAERTSISILGPINAVMMTSFSLLYFSGALVKHESVIGYCWTTALQCALFGAYCLTDLFKGAMLWTVSGRRRETSDGADPTPNYMSRLYADCGFSVGVLLHHLSCLTTVVLGIGYGLWRHEFIWTALFEASTPFLYLWSAYRTPHKRGEFDGRGTAGGTGDPTSGAMHPATLGSALPRFASYLMFLASFFVFRIAAACVGMYYLLRYRLPFSVATDERVLPGGASSPGFLAGFWATLALGIVPLLGMQLVWFRKIAGLWRAEALPLLEALLNMKVGSDSFEVVCEAAPARGQRGPKAKDPIEISQGQNEDIHKLVELFLGSNGEGREPPRAEGAAGVAERSGPPAVDAVSGRPRFRLTLHRPWEVVYAFATRGDVGFGERYVKGDWSCQMVGALPGQVAWDHGLYVALRHLCRVCYDGRGASDKESGSLVSRCAGRVSRLLAAMPDHASVRLPNLAGSAEARRESISEHYDGNQDLFKAFQGPTRVYTAACFDSPDVGREEEAENLAAVALPPPAPRSPYDAVSEKLRCVRQRHRDVSRALDAAQRRKIARILGDLGGLAPRRGGGEEAGGGAGARVLDLGCGYGELVLQACRDYHVAHAVGVTNSVEMAQEFKRRVEAEHAGEASVQMAASLEQADFLELPPSLVGHGGDESSKYDLITSVESLEAIYHCQYRRLAAQCRRAVREDGRIVFQVIHAYGSRNPTIRRKTFQPGCTFVQVYIFPGQQLPYLEYVLDEFRAEGLVCTHVEQSGLHYAKTLRTWREKLWYEDTFGRGGRSWTDEEYRKFAFYLAWCEAGFREGVLDVARCVFVKA